MARPVKRRRICGLPQVLSFAPRAGRSKEEIELTLDEYEVIRLMDLVGLTQEECAGQMNVARTTVQSIYDSARSKLADMLVNGKALKIAGGSYEVCPRSEGCCGKSCGDHACREKRCHGGGCADCETRGACATCRSCHKPVQSES